MTKIEPIIEMTLPTMSIASRVAFCASVYSTLAAAVGAAVAVVMGTIVGATETDVGGSGEADAQWRHANKHRQRTKEFAILHF